MASEFERLDSNHDGLLNREEYAADRTEAQAARADEEFLRLDRNGDQRLTRAEFTQPSHWKWWVGAFSLLMFLGSLIAVPLIVVRLPHDYFLHVHRADEWLRPAAVRVEWLIFKNLCGALLTLGGVAMLVLPGQGMLTILLGVALMDFPGKPGLVRWIVKRPGILASMNWIRRIAKRRPMTVA